jgi:hypothetical protein
VQWARSSRHGCSAPVRARRRPGMCLGECGVGQWQMWSGSTGGAGSVCGMGVDSLQRMLWPPPVQRPCASVFSTASGKVSFSDPGCAVQAATLATQRESCMLSLLAAGCGSQPGYALACTPTGCTNECGLGVELHDALKACCRKSYGEPHDGERPYSFLARAECTAASAHTNRGQTHSTAF